jgi:excisionase family DNA binding protein
MTNRPYITISELADLLGISHVAVWKRVKKGQIKAEKIGNMYVITDWEVAKILRKKPTAKDKSRIEKAVKKVVEEYGDVLRKLGTE